MIPETNIISCVNCTSIIITTHIMYHAFNISFKNTFLSPCHEDFSPIFLSQRWGSFFFFACNVWFFHHYLLKRLSSVRIAFASLLKSIGCVCLGVFLDSLLCSVDLCVCPFTNTTLSWWRYRGNCKPDHVGSYKPLKGFCLLLWGKWGSYWKMLSKGVTWL